MKIILSVLMAAIFSGCGNGTQKSENKVVTDSVEKSNQPLSTNSCKVEVKCHYNFSVNIDIWNVTIDGVKYHKPFASNTTDDEVNQNAIEDCKTDLLYADRWQDKWDKECK